MAQGKEGKFIICTDKIPSFEKVKSTASQEGGFLKN